MLRRSPHVLVISLSAASRLRLRQQQQHEEASTKEEQHQTQIHNHQQQDSSKMQDNDHHQLPAAQMSGEEMIIVNHHPEGISMTMMTDTFSSSNGVNCLSLSFSRNNNGFSSSFASSSSMLFRSTPLLFSPSFTLPSRAKISVDAIHNNLAVVAKNNKNTNNNETQSSLFIRNTTMVNPLLAKIPETIYLYSWEGFNGETKNNQEGSTQIEEGQKNMKKQITSPSSSNKNNNGGNKKKYGIEKRNCISNNDSKTNSIVFTDSENEIPLNFLVSTVPFHQKNLPQDELQKLLEDEKTAERKKWLVNVFSSSSGPKSSNASDNNNNPHVTTDYEEAVLSSPIKTRFLEHAKSIRKNVDEKEFSIWLDKAMLFGGKTHLLCRDIRHRLNEITAQEAKQQHDDANTNESQQTAAILKLFGEVTDVAQTHVEIPLMKIKDELRLSLVHSSYSNSLLNWCRSMRDDFFNLMNHIQELASEEISAKVKFEEFHHLKTNKLEKSLSSASETRLITPVQAKRKRMYERRALRNLALKAATEEYLILQQQKQNGKNSSSSLSVENLALLESDTNAPSELMKLPPRRLDQTQTCGSLSSLVQIDGKNNAASVTFTKTNNMESTEQKVYISPLCSIPLARLNLEVPIANFDWLRGMDLSRDKLVGFARATTRQSSSSFVLTHQNDNLEFRPESIFLEHEGLFDFDSLTAMSIDPSRNSLMKNHNNMFSSSSSTIVPLPIHPLSSSSSPKTCQVLFRNNYNVRSAISNIFTGNSDCFSDHYWRLYTGLFRQLFVSPSSNSKNTITASNPLWVFALDAFRMAMNCCSVSENFLHGTQKSFTFQTKYREPMSVVDCLQDIYYQNNFPRHNLQSWDAISLLLISNHKTFDKAFPFNKNNKNSGYNSSSNRKAIDEHLFECRVRCWSNALFSLAVENNSAAFSQAAGVRSSSLRRMSKNRKDDTYMKLLGAEDEANNNDHAGINNPKDPNFNYSFVQTLQSATRNLPSVEKDNNHDSSSSSSPSTFAISNEKFESVALRLLQLADYLYYEFNAQNELNGSNLELYLRLKGSTTASSSSSVLNGIPNLTINKKNLNLLTDFFVPDDKTSLLKGITIGGRAVAGLNPNGAFVAAKNTYYGKHDRFDQYQHEKKQTSPLDSIHRFYRVNRTYQMRFVSTRNHQHQLEDTSSTSASTITALLPRLTSLQNILPAFRFSDIQKDKKQELFSDVRRSKIYPCEQFQKEFGRRQIFTPLQQEIFQLCSDTFDDPPKRSLSCLYNSLLTFPENVVPNLEWGENAADEQQQQKQKPPSLFTGGFFSNAICFPMSPCFLHPLPAREFSRSLHRHVLDLDRFVPSERVSQRLRSKSYQQEQEERIKIFEKIKQEAGENKEQLLSRIWFEVEVNRPISTLNKVIEKESLVKEEMGKKLNEFKNRVVPLVERLSVEQLPLAIKQNSLKENHQSKKMNNGPGIVRNFVSKILGW